MKRKKYAISILAILLLLLVNCKFDSEVLAEFTGGKITRKDLREFYPSFNIPQNENTTAIKYQMSILESIGVESIAGIEAEKQGKTKSEMFKSITELKEKQILVNLYRKTFLEKEMDKIDLDMVSAQMLYIKKDQNNKPSQAKLDSLWNEIQNLKSDKEINALFSKESDELGRKPVAGFVEPQCMNCLKDNILKDIFKEGFEAKETKKFFKSEINNDYFIYRILEIKKIKKSDLLSYMKKKNKEIITLAKEFATKGEEEKKQAEYYLKDEVQVERELEMIVQRYTSELENQVWTNEFKKQIDQSKLQFSKEIQSLFDGLSNELPNFTKEYVLFTKDGKEYKYSDLESEFQKVNIKNITQTKNDSFAFFQSAILPIAIFYDKKESQDLKNSDSYKKEIQSWRNKISWSLLVQDLESKIPVPDDAKLKDIYEVGKNSSYSKPNPSNPNATIPIPFADVKQRIIEEIKSNSLKSEIQKYVETLKSNYQFKVYSDKLKPNAV